MVRVVSSIALAGALVLGGCDGCRKEAGDGAPDPLAGVVAAEGTGVLVVRAGSDFPFRVLDSDGEEVAEGTCNIHQPELPPGSYRVVISANGTQVTVGPTRVDKDQKATLELGGFGTLKVEAPKDFMKFQVKNAAGEVAATGDTNITTVGLAVGTYSVAVDTSPFPTTIIENVTVKENEEVNPKVTGFGLIMVKASEDFVDYTVLDADGKQVGEGQTNISSLLLPVGDLTVVVGEKKTKLTVADGDDKSFRIEL